MSDNHFQMGYIHGYLDKEASPKTQARMSSDEYPKVLKSYHEWIADRIKGKRQQGASGKDLGNLADTLRKQLQTWKKRFAPIPK